MCSSDKKDNVEDSSKDLSGQGLTGKWGDEQNYMSPNTSSDEDKFTIAIVQSGDYINYRDNFYGILNGLAELGWINPVDEIENADERPIIETIQMIESTSFSDYIKISSDLFFDFFWDESDIMIKRPRLQRIINSEEVDMIISFGTIAGRVLSGARKDYIGNDFLPKNFDTPVLIAGISDPIESGIIKSAEDSGKDYLTGIVDQERFKRQVRLFYEMVEFEKLGVVYADTPIGKTYAAINDIKQVAEEKGFEVISSTNLVAQENIESNSKKRYIQALEEVSTKVDAVYLVVAGGLELRNIREIMDVVNSHNLPSFAMEGSDYVKHGVLFSMATIQGKQVGAYHAHKIVEILKGTTPRSLDQRFNPVPTIAVNLGTAELIGFEVPVDLLRNADKIFYEIIDYKKD